MSGVCVLRDGKSECLFWAFGITPAYSNLTHSSPHHIWSLHAHNHKAVVCAAYNCNKPPTCPARINSKWGREVSRESEGMLANSDALVRLVAADRAYERRLSGTLDIRQVVCA